MPWRRIAIEEAFVTPEVLKEWGRLASSGRAEPGFMKMAQSILADTPATATVHARLLDIGAGRIDHMSRVGVDVQVLSLTSPGVQAFQAPLATRLASEANDILADAVRAHPSRFAALGAIAPQDPEGAAREIERIGGPLGLNGIVINSHTNGQYLDDLKFDPIFAAAEAQDLPIYLHPREPSPALIGPMLDYGLYFAGWGFAVETGLHAMRLIMSGLFDRHPRVRIILGHMGEGIPFWLQRIDNRYLLQVKIGAVAKLPRLPSEYFRENFVITTSGVCFMPALRLAIDVLGVEKVLWAADYPYEDDAEAVAFLEDAPISDHERRLIFEDNAVRVLKLAQ